MMPIFALQQKDAPLPRGPNSRVCVMSLANLSKFERLFDRVAPAFLLALGLASAAAFAAIGA